MTSERITKIKAAGLPPDLTTLLVEFAEAAEAFIPAARHSPGRQMFFNRIVDGVLEEVYHPEVEDHWWESDLFYFTRAAGETEEPEAKAVRAVGERLVTGLRAHLGPYDEVSLREISLKTVHGICRLSNTLSEPRKFFVGENVYSLVEALFDKKAWYRAIYAGKAPVGFLMVNVDNPKPGHYFCSRFMLAEPFHWRDYGRRAVDLMAAWVKSQPGATTLWGSAGEGEGSPKNFWRQCGFVPTGVVDEGEIVMARPLENAHVRAPGSQAYTGDSLKAKIRDLIMNECLPGESPDKLVDDTPLREVLDSMSELKLVNLIEDDTGLRVDARELSKSLENLTSLMTFIQRRQGVGL